MKAVDGSAPPIAALQPADVGSERVLAGVGHLADAVREHQVRHRRRGEQLHRQVGEVGDVVGLELGAPGEAREAVVDVGAEAGLHSSPSLTMSMPASRWRRDDLLDGAVEPRVDRGGVDRVAVDAGPDHLGEVVGARQAAGVGREDAVGLFGHRASVGCGCCSWPAHPAIAATLSPDHGERQAALHTARAG